MSISQDMRNYWKSGVGRAGKRRLGRINSSNMQNFITVGVCLPSIRIRIAMSFALQIQKPHNKLAPTLMRVRPYDSTLSVHRSPGSTLPRPVTRWHRHYNVEPRTRLQVPRLDSLGVGGLHLVSNYVSITWSSPIFVFTFELLGLYEVAAPAVVSNPCEPFAI